MLSAGELRGALRGVPDGAQVVVGCAVPCGVDLRACVSECDELELGATSVAHEPGDGDGFLVISAEADDGFRGIPSPGAPHEPGPGEAGWLAEWLGYFDPVEPVWVVVDFPQIDWRVSSGTFVCRQGTEGEPELVVTLHMTDFDYPGPLRKLWPLVEDALFYNFLDVDDFD